MVISPKFRGFICTTAHPEGCSENIKNQIEYVKCQKPVQGPKRVLVIGSATGYGLASRIVAAFGAGASTLGLAFERPASGNRTATAGWYNTAAFEKAAHEAGLYAKSVNGDAFSSEIKKQVIDIIKEDLGQVDLVVYSLGAPRRTHPLTGEVFNSVIKPIGKPYTNKTVDFHNGVVTDITVESANEEEIRHTVAVMGGEDWQMWMEALDQAGVLAEGVITVAYSYVGPKVTQPIYREGTLGRAKDHLEATVEALNGQLQKIGGKAYVSVNKALVTQSSSAIPVVPLYMSILYKLMKEKGIHEGCIEQMYRLFNDRLYGGHLQLDEKSRIRIDDWEMREDVQQEAAALWDAVNSGNIYDVTDLAEYRREFFQLFGFGLDTIDYNRDVEIAVAIPSIPMEEA